MRTLIHLDIETVPPAEEHRAQLREEIERERLAAGDTANKSAAASGSETANKSEAAVESAAAGKNEAASKSDAASDQLSATIEERFRRLALSGERGRLLCVGVIVERGGEITERGVLGRDRATGLFHLQEERTLTCFWRLLARSHFDPCCDLLIGYNILEFDLPFLLQRSVVHGVAPSVRLSFARYRSQPIYDVMMEWAGWSWKRCVSLDRLARALGLESSKQGELDGRGVYDYFTAGRHREIADYCLRDVELTRTIYKRLTFADR